MLVSSLSSGWKRQVVGNSFFHGLSWLSPQKVPMKGLTPKRGNDVGRTHLRRTLSTHSLTDLRKLKGSEIVKLERPGSHRCRTCRAYSPVRRRHFLRRGLPTSRSGLIG